MNEIEKAISAIETAFEQEPPAIVEDGYGFYLVIEDALATALAALREQAERNKGCCLCGTGKGKLITQPDGTFVRYTRYCDYCGKRLEEHHDAD